MVGITLAATFVVPTAHSDAVVRGLLPDPAPAVAVDDAPIIGEAVAAGSGSSAGAPTADDAGLQPTVHYEEALRHASDRIAFVPGKRVALGFTPRPGDPWTIDGGAPTPLPAGRLDGARIRAQSQLPLRNRPASSPAETTGAAGAGAADDRRSLAMVPASYVVSSTEPGAGPIDARVSPDGLRKEIFGFLPYWELNTSSLRLDYSKISTIAYFGIGADAAGNLQKRNPDGSVTVGWSGWTSSKMTSIIGAAHAAHTRVVLTVQSFGWNASGLARQRALLTSSTARANLARQIAAAVRDRGADGVNLDFEPLASGAEAGFTALVRSIRAQLNRIHGGYQVTFDTTGSIGNYPIESATAPGGADAIFIMGYDYRTGGSSPVGSVAPYAKSGYDIVDTVKAYAARVSPSKLILGVPYYGRAWSTNGNLLNAPNISGTKYGASTTVTYDTAAEYLAQYGRNYDTTEAVAWTAYKRQNCTASYGCVTSWRELYVDDAAALQKKYALVNAYRLRGAGIWALGFDGTRPELYAAIKRSFMTDTTPPIAGISILPTRQPNPEFWVAWTGRDDVGVVSYDVQRSTDGGPWAAWLTGTTATRAIFDGDDGHSYAFRVRARDRKGNVSPFNVVSTANAPAALAPGTFASARADGLSVRMSPDTSALKVGTLRKGAVVAIVGGPKTADGYTWFQVVGPLREWGVLDASFVRRWVAARSSSTTYLGPAAPPNATAVRAMLGGVSFGGAGAASIGPGAGAVGARSFSPNGDGSRDGLAIAWTNRGALDSLALRVFRADGTAVGTVPLAALKAGAQRFVWNGRVGTSRVPDGRYVVSLVGKTGAATWFNPIVGWRPAALAVYGVTVDTVAPKVTSSSISGGLLSPNGDGRLDTVRATIVGTGAARWSFAVVPLTGPNAGKTIVSRSGGGGSVGLTWGGVAADGRVVADGVYRLQLALFDVAGNHVLRTWAARVDRTGPGLTVGGPPWFSPNGDGAADGVRLSWTATERITGTLRVYRGATLVRSWTITNAAAGATTWNGTNLSGAAVADGTYTVRVAGRDAAGNLSIATRPVIVDRTLSTLRWGTSPFFAPDGDALKARSTISVRLARSAVVTGGIYSGTTLVRRFWLNARLGAGTRSWTWNGRNAAGAFVPPGRYVARVDAKTALGTTTLTRSVLVDAFDVALSTATLRAGQTLTVTFRTVEPLAGSPSVTFTQPGRTGVRKTATSLGSGRYRVSFVVASGASGAATITIRGRDTGGGVNTTTRRVTIR
jgi:spore germination protein YaaH/flagellar hook assembly protein FlgD